ncbi:hypothetical protein QPK60_21980 [Aeromonas caviae]|uniref:hypothetical protein n=1 Tax=Aeromonas caviae TaxID=648 RepID=UPI002541F22E|nr:hypothetical protein [Aeromonas caviae]MDK3166754.1 hypothetical protein [Aeromonas caviae]
MTEMTKEAFLQLQDELEGLELAIAKGEETDNTDSRLKELESLMEVSIHQDGVDGISSAGMG